MGAEELDDRDLGLAIARCREVVGISHDRDGAEPGRSDAGQVCQPAASAERAAWWPHLMDSAK